MCIRQFIACTVLGIIVSAAARADITSISLENPSVDFALNPETGMLAAVEQDKDQVRFYPNILTTTSAKDTTPLTVAKGPTRVIFKKYQKNSYFIVLCHDANRAVLIDPVTLKQAKEIPLSAGDATFMMSSISADDPYVYFTGTQPRVPGSAGVLVVDLRVNKEVGSVFLGGVIGGDMGDGAISADGRMAYGKAVNTSPSGFSAVNIIQQDAGVAPKTMQAFYNHITIGKYVADPFGQIVGVDNSLYSRDLTAKLATVDGSVVCFLQNKPFIVAITNGNQIVRGRRGVPNDQVQKLLLISYNSYKTVASMDIPQGNPNLPADRQPPRQNNQRLPFGLHVLADPKNDNILVSDERTVHIVPVKDFDAPDEPFLIAAVEGNTQLIVGQAASFKLTRMDPATKIELQESPKGMAIQGDTLTWTPTVDDIGAVKVALRLSAGASEKIQELALRVSRQTVKLPFAPTTFELSPDGSVALIASMANMNFGVPTNPQDSLNSRLALVDLKSSALLADRTLLNAASAVAIDGNYVYAASRDSDAFYVLSRKDLSEVKRLFSQGHVRALIPRGGKLIVLTDSGSTTILKTSDFSVVESPAARAAQNQNPFNPNERYPLSFVDMGDGVLLNGFFLDSSLEKIQAISQIDQLQTVSLNVQQQPQQQYMGNVASSSRWGVSVTPNGTLLRANGQSAGQFDSRASIVLPDRPMVVSMVMDSRGGNGMGQNINKTASISFRDVITGAVQQTVRVFDEPMQQRQDDNMPPGMGMIQPLRAANGKVALLASDNLYLVDIPADDPGKFAAPLQIPADQGVVVLGNKPTTLRFTVAGGKADIEYGMTRETPGVEIDKSGLLTIQSGTWMDQAVNVLSGQNNQFGDLASYQKTASAVFKMLTGRDPKGIPVAIRFTVTARDKDLQTASADRVVLIEVPVDLVDKKVAALQSSQNRAPMPTSRPSRDDQSVRIEQLERRIDILEGKIDLLTKMMGDRANK